MKLKRIEVPLEIKAADEGGIEGYGSVFGNVDSYGDIVAKGAFDLSIKAHQEKGTSPAMLWQHNADWPIGRWTEIREDERGLYLKGELADTAQGKDVRTLARMGAITGLSIGFIPNQKKTEFDDKTGIRTIKEVDLWEVSLVTFPANDQARVLEARAAEIDEMDRPEIERQLRNVGLSQREAKTVCSRLMSLGAQRNAATTWEAAQAVAKAQQLAKILRR